MEGETAEEKCCKPVEGKYIVHLSVSFGLVTRLVLVLETVFAGLRIGLSLELKGLGLGIGLATYGLGLGSLAITLWVGGKSTVTGHGHYY